MRSYAVACVLGWSNPDTGPNNKRLYATDQVPSPRWANPRARVVEDALEEFGVHEGTRVVVVALPAGVSNLDVDRVAAACLDVVAEQLSKSELP